MICEMFDLWVCYVIVSGMSTLQLFGWCSSSLLLFQRVWIPTTSAGVWSDHSHAQLYPLLQTVQVNVHSLRHNSSKIFSDYRLPLPHTFWFFSHIWLYIIPLPLMKTRSTRWNEKVNNKGKDWLVFESSPSFSFKCKEVQWRKNKINNKQR